jgi:nitrite reductase/ring-hydroxylating ferredoxin subunit
MKRHVVCRVDEMPLGARKIVEIDGKSIGVFNVGGEFYALRNLCPHQFAPLCEGKVTGFCEPSGVGEYKWIRDGEIIRCPWHAWEFDIKTGRSIFNPQKVRTRRYEITIENCGKNDEPGQLEIYEVEIEGEVVALYA